MKHLRIVLVVVLLTTFPSVYGGDCFEDGDIEDCRVKAEQGDADLQNNLGMMYAKGLGVLQDYKEAVKWYRKSAEQGNSEAEYNLGVTYAEGLGVLQDYKEAAKWYRKSAEQGYSSAQFNLGRLYARGEGVPEDYVRAHMYWNIAAINGDKSMRKARGVIEELMTPTQIEKAQDLAREWMRTH